MAMRIHLWLDLLLPTNEASPMKLRRLARGLPTGSLGKPGTGDEN